MKKRDSMTTIGLVAGFLAIVFGITAGGTGSFGTKLKSFFDLSSVFITIFGSFCALLVNYPISEIKKLMKINAQAFKQNTSNGLDVINNFVKMSRKARREGLLSLEDEIQFMDDKFLIKGIQMVIDGIEPETIREVMELEISEMERRHRMGSQIIKAWGGYAPAFGMIGTLIGLIQMLANLNDSSLLASGMSKALITTFYGSVLANLVLNPISAKLDYKTDIEVNNKEMILEGILAIQSGVNPRIVEEKLVSYLPPEERVKINENQYVEDGVVENA